MARFCQRRPGLMVAVLAVSLGACLLAVMEYALITSFLQIRLTPWQTISAWTAGWLSFLVPVPGGCGCPGSKPGACTGSFRRDGRCGDRRESADEGPRHPVWRSRSAAGMERLALHPIQSGAGQRTLRYLRHGGRSHRAGPVGGPPTESWTMSELTLDTSGDREDPNQVWDLPSCSLREQSGCQAEPGICNGGGRGCRGPAASSALRMLHQRRPRFRALRLWRATRSITPVDWSGADGASSCICARKAGASACWTSSGRTICRMRVLTPWRPI